jgi:hypothetical protein
LDELTKFLVKELIDGKSVTAIYGGGFKPPTKGHFDLVKTALKDFKDIDKFIIYVGSGIRDGIEQEQALQIWDIYKELLPSKVQIEPSGTPIGDIMRYAKNHPDEKVYFVIGYREGREDDLDDIKNRTKGVEEKYPNLEVRVIKTPSGDMSGTNARKALKKGDKEQFFTYLPTEVPDNEKEDIYNILETTVLKEVEMGTVQFDVLDNYNQQDIIDDIKNKFNKFISAVKQENKETKESVSLLIKAARGNTTLTDKQKKEIGDQLKDVLRLIGLTAIATLPGGFIAAALIKLFKAESLITPSSFANEGSCGYDTEVKTGKQLNTPGGLEEGDPKTGTGKKPKGSSRRLYTDEDPSDTVKVKFSTKQDIIDTFSKASFKSKPHARQSQVINLIHQRVRAAYERSKDPEVKKRLKTALDYAEQKKEASKEKTQRLKKENVAPNHDGKSAPFGSGYKQVKEITAFGNPPRYRAIEKRGDKYYYIQDNPFAPGIRQEFGPYKTKEQAKKKMGTFPPSQNYRDITENTIPSIDILEKIAELTNYMREKGYNIDPAPSIELVGDDMVNAEKFLGKTAYYDPINKSITIYTYGRHPKDIVRSYAHEMIHHIQNLDGRLGDVPTTNTLEDDHVNDLEKEANLKGTMTFRNWTDSIEEDGQKTSNKNIDDYKKQNNPSNKVKDPFGLNQYARELAQGLEEEQLTEGRYDKLTNELSSFAFELMKDGYDVGKKVVDELFVVGPADEEVDIVSDEFKFDFVVQATYTEDTYKVDGGANAGFDDEGDEIQPLLTVRFKIPKDIDWQTVSFDLKDVIRHELEHLTQDGENLKGGTDSDDPRLVRPSKYMEDDEFIRDMIDANLLPKSDYFKLEKEIDAMLQGLYFKAKKSRKPYLEVIDDYLDKQPVNPQERKDILDLWAKRAKALSLPSFTSAYVKESSYLYDTGVEKMDKEMGEKKYVIFCDMDGVLVDFDKGYKDLTGLSTKQADAQGKSEFWKLFGKSLKEKNISDKSYWASLDWMPDGKQLWSYISPYNPYVLTAPSVNFDIPFEDRYKLENNESMQGKTEWVQRLPNMRKLYFRSAGRKADFAGPDKILIDDRKDTIDSWNANGGIGILHTSTANTIKQLQDLGL